MDIGHSPEAESQLKKWEIGKLKGYSEEAGKKAPAAKSATPKAVPDVPLAQKIIVPVVLLLLAYGVNWYFTQ